MMAPGPDSAKNLFPIGDDADELEDFDLTGPEFRSLNSAMDQLQVALDLLESRNAGIHQELLELLQSNREMRMSFNQDGNEEQNHEEKDESDVQNMANTDQSSTKCDAEPTASCSHSISSESPSTIPIQTHQESDTWIEPVLAELKLTDSSTNEENSS